MNNPKGNGIVIRHLEPRDVTPVMAMIEQNWDRESADLAGKEIIAALAGTKPQPVYFVAWFNGTVLGAIGICDSHMDTRIYEIFWVNVRPDWQDAGIGRMLVKRALEIAEIRLASLVLLTTKAKTVPFYQKLGFHMLSPNEPGDQTAMTVDMAMCEADFIMRAKPRQALDFITMRERTVE